jgi:hypothetical protein
MDGYKRLDVVSAERLMPVHVMERQDDDGTGWQMKAAYRLSDIETLAGVKSPRVPVKYDENIQTHIPDWDNISEEDQDILARISDAAIEASGCYAFSRGPGQAFQHAPTARVYRRFVVVNQFGGLDV